MNFNALGSGSSLSAYVTSLLDKTTANNGSSAPATRAETAMKNAAAAALSTASHSQRSTVAQSALAHSAQGVASDLQAAMSKAGIKLGGTVEFSLNAQGGLSVSGSDADEAAVQGFLKNDKSRPSFASRVGSLAGDADKLSSQIRQAAAISQAARYAGGPSNVMSLYGSLLQQQDTTPAVFSLSSAGGSLTYPGVLASKA